MRRLGLITWLLLLLDGILTFLSATSFIVMVLCFANGQLEGGFLGLFLTAVFGYAGWIVFNKFLDRLPDSDEVA